MAGEPLPPVPRHGQGAARRTAAPAGGLLARGAAAPTALAFSLRTPRHIAHVTFAAVLVFCLVVMGVALVLRIWKANRQGQVWCVGLASCAGPVATSAGLCRPPAVHSQRGRTAPWWQHVAASSSELMLAPQHACRRRRRFELVRDTTIMLANQVNAGGATDTVERWQRH